MRTVALALALAGCDWVFGLNHTTVIPGDAVDAGPGTDGPVIPISFEWQVAATTTSGLPTTPVVAPIVPAPAVSIGPVDGPLVPATYDATNGTLSAPYKLAGQAYRIDYNIGGEPIEVQLDRNSATLLLPHLSRTTAPPVPVNSGYDLLPIGLPASGLQNPQLATSGVYTLSPAPPARPAEVRFALGSASPMQGPLAAPQTVEGDWQLLLDWPTSPTADPYTITGYAITEVDLTANRLSSPQTQPTWETTTTTYAYDDTFTVSEGTRLKQVMNVLSNGATPTFHIAYGIAPSTQIVPFVAGRGAGPDQALMIPLYTSNNVAGSLTVIDVDATVAQQPRALVAQALLPRTSDGVTLTSALQSITTPVTSTAPLPLNAPLAVNELFATEPLDGSQGLSDVPITKAPTLTLTWDLDKGTADDFIVRLYEILNGGSIAIQTYQVLSPQVTVDGSLLDSGHTYAFGITARSGIPMAHSGDYSTVTLPFSEATTFPATFTIR
jgi:hypothetical protein